MNQYYGFLKDLPLWVKGPQGKQLPEAEIFALAEFLDHILLFDEACQDYLRTLIEELKAHSIRANDPALAPLPYEEPNDVVAHLISRPFRLRGLTELRTLSLERLVSNPIAIDQMSERLAEAALSSEWVAVHDEECDRVALRKGLGWVDAESVAEERGLVNQGNESQFTGLLRGPKGDEIADSDTPVVFRWHISASDSSRVQWQQGSVGQADSRFLDVQITAESADRLSVVIGGIGYIETGCSVKAQWLDSGGNVNAEAHAKDTHQILRLDNTTGTLKKSRSPTHSLKLHFQRTDPSPLAFTASIPLHEQL